VCSIRVIGESDIMQEFLSESDEVGTQATALPLCPDLPSCRGRKRLVKLDQRAETFPAKGSAG